MRKFVKSIIVIIIVFMLSLNYVTVFAAPPELPNGENNRREPPEMRGRNDTQSNSESNNN